MRFYNFFANMLFLAHFFIFYVVEPHCVFLLLALFILWVYCLVYLIVKALWKVWFRKCCMFKFRIIFTVPAVRTQYNKQGLDLFILNSIKPLRAACVRVHRRGIVTGRLPV